MSLNIAGHIKTEHLLEELEYRIGNGEKIPNWGNTGIFRFAIKTLQNVNTAINNKTATVPFELDQDIRMAIKDIDL